MRTTVFRREGFHARRAPPFEASLPFVLICLVTAICTPQDAARAQGGFAEETYNPSSPGLSQSFNDTGDGSLLGTFQTKPSAHPDTDDDGDSAPGADDAAGAALPVLPSPLPGPREEASPSPANSSPANTAAPSRKADPVELYLSALAELNFGRILQAELLLQQVIASNPSSNLAELARRRLEDLVRSRKLRKGVGAVAADAPQQHRPAPPPVRSSVGKNSDAAERRRNSRDLAIEQAFRTEVGDRVFFGPGSAHLGARARAAISNQARWLLKWPELDARVEGHADEPGSAEHNMELSRDRAAAVRDRLIAEGLDAERIQLRALGSEHPVAVCDGPGCRAQNSRVVTVVYVSSRTVSHRRSGALSSGPGASLPVATRDVKSGMENDEPRVPR